MKLTSPARKETRE